jgi:K+/H+ antiporter YhaU regulatory subunit KhtT
VGTYSGTVGSTSEWEASCRIVTDRSLLEHYPIDTITNGLFEATNKLWEKLTPRMEALKKRSEKAQQVSSTLAQLKSLPQRFGSITKPKPEVAKQEVKEAATTMSKVHLISRS